MFEMPKPERPIGEERGVRIKRLAMRSMRRGIKEMDLILSAYATDHLDGMSDEGLVLYDDLLNESDHDLYQWVTLQTMPDPVYAEIVKDIQDHISKG